MIGENEYNFLIFSISYTVVVGFECVGVITINSGVLFASVSATTTADCVQLSQRDCSPVWLVKIG